MTWENACTASNKKSAGNNYEHKQGFASLVLGQKLMPQVENARAKRPE